MDEQGLMMALVEDAGPSILRAWMATLRHRIADGWRDFDTHRRRGPVIWAFWHGQIFEACFVGRDRGMRTLISPHRDGEIVARIAKGFGYDVVRGSSSRGGMEALREMARTAGRQDLAITPDGPRGPRQTAQGGAIYLAELTGRPIVPIGLASFPCLHLRGWDRFEAPLPFAAVGVALGEPFFVPRPAGRETRDRCRAELEERLACLTDVAERVARGHGGQPYSSFHLTYAPYTAECVCDFPPWLLGT